MKKPVFCLPLVVISIVLLWAYAPVQAGRIYKDELPPAPTAPARLSTPAATALPVAPAAPQLAYRKYLPFAIQADSGLRVNIHDRQAVLNFYNQEYLGAVGAAIDWTGSQSQCLPGATAPAFKDDVIHRVNFFRAMAGVPANVTLLDDMNRKTQAAVLIMSANGMLSHYPDSSWKCYSSDGAAGASSSLIALGISGWDTISLYMLDPGIDNSAAGHRRWILYPQTRNMGTGDIPSSSYAASNALYIFDNHYSDPRPTVRDGFVSWPPSGYVPNTLVFARWSFSYPDADFSAAAVSMSSNGAAISLSQAPTTYGYGENTLVWIPLGMADNATWPRPTVDTTYHVSVSNVYISGAPRSFSYDVTIFGP